MFSGPTNTAEERNTGNSAAAVKARLLPQSGGSREAAAQQGGSVRVKERKFDNGDRYHGGWLNGLPEGEGKYEWNDGSCYEGGWKAGHKHGVGKYTWTSGASYQGEWRNGFMHGVGTFEAPDGSKYQGGWREDLKHGLGRKIYANGDVYEGLWASGKPDGPGKYIWVDFNEYDGEWRSGRLHGQGTFVWKTGERYDGEWKDGQEDGVGVFTFRDGSTYEGFWRRGKKHGVGIFRPASAQQPPRTRSLAGLRLDSTLNRSMGGANAAAQATANAGGGRAAFAEATAAAAAMPDEAAADYMVPKTPKGAPSAGLLEPGPQLQPDAAGSSRSITSVTSGRMNVLQQQYSRRRTVTVIKEYEEGKLVQQYPLSPADIAAVTSALLPPGGGSPAAVSGGGAGGHTSGGGAGGSSRPHLTPLGEVVYKEHSAYDLMVQLQLGIRWSVTSAALDHTSPAALQTGLQPPDYATTITQEFPRAGSRSTPVHPAADFVWKDYAPSAFRMLREQAGVQQHHFISQLCGDQALRLLSSPGKSGAMFFLSADERFLVKTITSSEGKLLLAMLQRYSEHMRKYPNSLLSRFYGLHRVSSPPGGIRKKVRFVVMGNIFCTGLAIHRRFDLKGSTKGRTVGPAAAKAPTPTTILKDLDLTQCFKLEQGWTQRLAEQLAADTALLAAAGVMDYSLLLGVHERGKLPPGRGGGGSSSSSSPFAAAGGSAAPPAGAAAAAGVGGGGAAAVVPAAAAAAGSTISGNFVEHSSQPGLDAAVVRLEGQLGRLHLEKWVQAALMQLARVNLLMGLASGGASRPGGHSSAHSRRTMLARSPTLVLATRPKRCDVDNRPLSLVPGGTDDIALSLGQTHATLGINMAAIALPLTDPPGGRGKQDKQQQRDAGQDVVLYFGIIDVLQGYTLRKQLESGLRRLTASVQAISAVAPPFYAERFRKFMAKVFP